ARHEPVEVRLVTAQALPPALSDTGDVLGRRIGCRRRHAGPLRLSGSRWSGFWPESGLPTLAPPLMIPFLGPRPLASHGGSSWKLACRRRLARRATGRTVSPGRGSFGRHRSRRPSLWAVVLAVLHSAAIVDLDQQR